MTTGWVVVVVGGLVVEVVVVDGLVVVTSAEPVVGAVVVVDGVLVVVDAAVPGVAGCAVLGAGDGAEALAAAEEPGCSLATVTQMNAVAPPAATIAVLVKRLMRACAIVRATGECAVLPRVMADGRTRARARARSETRSTVRDSVRSEPEDSMTAGRVPAGNHTP